jgi:dolichyl-phosphate beta-glucosyltransferase
MRLSIVIPAYNEARRLGPTLEGIIAYLEGDGANWRPTEILVVDDGSHDGTKAVVGETTAPDGIEINCLVHPENRGKGAAVRTGFSASKGELILLCDADLATPIAELDRLAPAATGGMVIGSRAVDRSRIEQAQPWYRDLMGRTFNLAVRLLAVSGIHDTQCGFKLVDGGLGRRLAAVQQIDGFAYDVELLTLCRAWGDEVTEIPVRWRHVEESRVQPVAHSMEMLGDLLRVGWWRLSGRLADDPDPGP